MNEVICIGNKEFNQICIHGFVKQLKVFNDFRELTSYNICENFTKHGQIEYKLYNLEGIIEDGEACFDDAEGELEENDTYVLRRFLISSILSITQIETEGDNNYEVRIEFKDGYINILAFVS